jgi:hypothetical protein
MHEFAKLHAHRIWPSSKLQSPPVSLHQMHLSMLLHLPPSLSGHPSKLSSQHGYELVLLSAQQPFSPSVPVAMP